MAASILRMFVAIYPPEEMAREMLALVAARGLREEHRVTPVGQVHMTLQFIGEVSARELDGVVESVQRAAAGVSCFDLVPRRLRTLPHKGPPRLIAIETDGPGQLLEIQRRLVRRLARKPRKDARFLPHMTLLRFAGDAKPEAVDAPLDLPPFSVRAVVLVRSTLHVDGARHTRVDEAALLERPCQGC